MAKALAAELGTTNLETITRVFEILPQMVPAHELPEGTDKELAEMLRGAVPIR